MNQLDGLWSDFSSHISYDARLGVTLHWLSGSSDGENASASPGHDLNLSLLDTLLSLDEPWHFPGKDEDREQLLTHVHQLHARLSVVTAMLDQLTADTMPPKRDIRLNEYGCALALKDELAADCRSPADVELQLHFDGCRAVPLILRGHYDPACPGFIGFRELPPLLTERIGKLAFRQHRLKIAAHRQR